MRHECHGALGLAGHLDHHGLGLQVLERLPEPRGFRLELLAGHGVVHVVHRMGVDLRLVAQVGEHGHDVVARPIVGLPVEDAVRLVGQGVDDRLGPLGGELGDGRVGRCRGGWEEDAGRGDQRQHHRHQGGKPGEAGEPGFAPGGFCAGRRRCLSCCAHTLQPVPGAVAQPSC